MNSGTLCFAGRPVLDVLDDWLKPQKAESYTPPKPTRKVPVVVVVDTKKMQLQILQRIAERTRKRRIRQKVNKRIDKLEQCL
ncbi:hypothetical protein P4S95_27330 [Aneurinibacillus aneurinilyticus]|uniref:hypothetical protein n=1 Tax=Aneurinibacillus aneurinilyticus TaxID=1391 RepID=UPI002E1A1972|nr:hypothetical protein [Aneurinibacillus aneurinilyticus]